MVIKRNSISIFLLFVIILLSYSESYAASALGDFLCYRDITFDTTSNGASIAGNVGGGTITTGFPVCVHINSSSWPSSTERGHFFNDTHNPGGKRIQFFDSDGTTNLNYEVEYYDTATQNAVYWVGVPTVTYNSSTDKIILGYGSNPNGAVDQSNATGVWDSSYKGVWHLGEGATPSYDSTSGDNDGTWSNNTQVAGYVKNATNLNGTTAKITIANESNFDFVGNMTLSGWVKRNGTVSWQPVVIKGTTSTADKGYAIIIDNRNANKIEFQCLESSGVSLAKEQTLNPTDGWNHFGVVFNTDLSGTAQLAFYLNSAEGGTYYTAGSLTNIGTNNYSLIFGANPANSVWAQVDLDEVRISNNSRSADWIKLEYYSIKKTNYNGDTGYGGTSYPFIKFGSEVIKHYSVTGTSTHATVNCQSPISEGSTSECSITLSGCYSLSSVTTDHCDGSLVGSTYTTGAIYQNCIVTVNTTIKSLPYTVTPIAAGYGTITPSTPQSWCADAGLQFTVTASDSNTAIHGVTGCNGTLVGSTYTTGTISANCTVVAQFYTTIKHNTSSPSYNAFPYLARMGNGKCLIYYAKSQNHYSCGKVYQRISTDSTCNTWDSETEITSLTDCITYAYNNNMGGIKVMANGDLWITYTREPVGQGQTDYYIGYIKSTDNASTWSSPTTLSRATGHTNEATLGNIVVTQSGKWIYPYFYTLSGWSNYWNAAIKVSSDQGATWGNDVIIGDSDGSSKACLEVNCFVLNNGVVSCLMRSDGRGGALKIMETHSTNEEFTTWSVPVVAFEGTGAPRFYQRTGGSLISVYRSNDSAGSPSYRTAPYFGESWGAETKYDVSQSVRFQLYGMVIPDFNDMNKVISVYGLCMESSISNCWSYGSSVYATSDIRLMKLYVPLTLNPQRGLFPILE